MKRALALVLLALPAAACGGDTITPAPLVSTPTASVSSSPVSDTTAYSKVLLTWEPIITADASQLQSDCTPGGDTTTCEGDLTKTATDAQGWNDALSKLAVPSQLKGVDGTLRKGLTELKAGCEDAAQGYSSGDDTAVSKGFSEIADAGNLISQAGDQAQQLGI